MTKEQIDSLYESYCLDEYKVNKYQKAGIYCIKINDKIVYVGKSVNMLKRIVEHQCEIMDCGKRSANKYKVLNEAYKRSDCKIGFDVLYVSKRKSLENIYSDIGEAEARLINEYMPILNYQIPTIGNYRKYTVNKKAQNATLDEILGAKAFRF